MEMTVTEALPVSQKLLKSNRRLAHLVLIVGSKGGSSYGGSSSGGYGGEEQDSPVIPVILIQKGTEDWKFGRL